MRVMTSREAYIVLNRIEGMGPVRARALCEALGSPEAALGASAGELAAVRGVGRKVAEAIVTRRGELDAGGEEAAAAKLGARLVTPVDGEYPEALKTIYDPPLCLYVRGTLEKRDAQALAVVGTRRATTYGSAQADRLAFQAAKAGFTIVSGLARGIDTVAHRAALKAGGRTLAVLGGVDMEGARGPHRLIQNGARLVEELQDILREFEFLFPPAEQARLARQQDARQRLTLAPAEEAVVRALWAEPEVDFDVLIRKTGLAPAQLMTLAMQLEMKRVIRRLPGRRLALMDEIREWDVVPAEEPT